MYWRRIRQLGDIGRYPPRLVESHQLGRAAKVHSPVMLNCRSSRTWCAPRLWCLWRASRACAPGARPDHSISGALPLQFTVCAAIADHHANNTDRKWQETRQAYWRNSRLSRGRPRLPDFLHEDDGPVADNRNSVAIALSSCTGILAAYIPS
jgi:hypothetical protein